MAKGKNIVLDKSFHFACEILDLNDKLIAIKHFQLAKQVIRSGTSIGANITEAQRGASKPDFINKLGIALKEADETKYWLRLIDKKLFEIDAKMKSEIEEIISLLVAIINSSKKQTQTN